MSQLLKLSREYDPNLTKPVHFGTPPPKLPAAERTRLDSERGCLLRERNNIQRAIDHITDLLAA